MSMLDPAQGCGDLSLWAPHGRRVPLVEDDVLVVMLPYFCSGSEIIC